MSGLRVCVCVCVWCEVSLLGQYLEEALRYAKFITYCT